MDVTRERISRILELREILLAFQTGFNYIQVHSYPPLRQMHSDFRNVSNGDCHVMV